MNDDITQGKLEALRYISAVCTSKMLPFYNKSYLAACENIKISCDAAIERLESGEQMEAFAVCQKTP